MSDAVNPTTITKKQNLTKRTKTKNELLRIIGPFKIRCTACGPHAVRAVLNKEESGKLGKIRETGRF